MAEHSLSACVQLAVQVGSEVIIAVILGIVLRRARGVHRWKTWRACMLAGKCWHRQRRWDSPEVKAVLVRENTAGLGGIPLDLPIGASG